MLLLSVKNISPLRFLTMMLAVVFMIMPLSATAQDEYYDQSLMDKVTGKEKAVFGYFKLGKKAPDYEKWISANPAFQDLPAKKQEEYLISETLRLGGGYGHYSLDHDTLELEIPVNAKVTTKAENNESYFYMEFPNLDLEHNDLPSFHFPYADDHIALIVFELPKLQKMKLNQTQYEAISSKISEFDSFFPATLTLHIRPNEADYEKPVYRSDGSATWLMSGKIAYINCSYDDFRDGLERRKLWDYVAPWYKEIYIEKTTPKTIEYPDPFAHLKKQ